MADYQIPTIDTTDNPSSGQEMRDALLKLINDIDILKRSGLGDVITTLIAGGLQAEDVGGRILFKVVRSDQSEHPALAGEYLLRDQLDFAKFAVKQFRVEDKDTGSLLPVANGNAGLIERDSSLLRLVVGADAGQKRLYLGGMDVDGAHYRRMPVTVHSAPGEVALHGLSEPLFDDGADEAKFTTASIPQEWLSGIDPKLEALVRLNEAAGESDGDSIDFQTDYVAAVVGSGTFNGTTTNATGVGVIGASGTAQGTLHRVLIDLPRADLQNPLGAGRVIHGTLKRNGLTNVGGVLLHALHLLVPCYGAVDHEI